MRLNSVKISSWAVPSYPLAHEMLHVTSAGCVAYSLHMTVPWPQNMGVRDSLWCNYTEANFEFHLSLSLLLLFLSSSSLSSSSSYHYYYYYNHHHHSYFCYSCNWFSYASYVWGNSVFIFGIVDSTASKDRLAACSKNTVLVVLPVLCRWCRRVMRPSYVWRSLDCSGEWASS